jgi:hypothetical protein
LVAAVEAGEEVVVIDGAAVNPRLHLLMHHVVAERLLYDDPPEDWLAFEGLLERGVDPHEAQHAIGRHLVEELVAKLGPAPGQSPAPRARARGDRRGRERRKAQRAARRRNRR